MAEMGASFTNRKKSVLIASPIEDEKILRTKQCKEGVRGGAKAAAVACVASAVPTLAAIRIVSWAKANLNHTAHALLISAGVSGMNLIAKSI